VKETEEKNRVKNDWRHHAAKSERLSLGKRDPCVAGKQRFIHSLYERKEGEKKTSKVTNLLASSFCLNYNRKSNEKI
jgi:hypothetical protein